MGVGNMRAIFFSFTSETEMSSILHALLLLHGVTGGMVHAGHDQTRTMCSAVLGVAGVV